MTLLTPYIRIRKTINSSFAFGFAVYEQARHLLRPFTELMRVHRQIGIEVSFSFLNSERYELVRQVAFAGVTIKRLLQK